MFKRRRQHLRGLAGLLGCPAAALLTAVCAAAAPAAAERIFVHGHIVTGEGLTGASPRRVSALAVREERIVVSGTDAQALRLRGPGTEVIDLQGAFVVPGFNDAHVHLAAAGLQALRTDLRGSRSLAAMLARVQAAARSAPPGAWILGGGWDHTLWADRRLPARGDLDGITAGHPALLERIDGHIAIANSAALGALGVDRTVPDPRGGRIDRDPSGELTGIVRDTAMVALEAKIPPPSPAQLRRALEVATADAVSHGLTSAQDYSSWEAFRQFESMERAHQLPLRVSEWLTFNDPVAVLTRERAAHPAADPRLHTGMLKGFMDGSLGSRTAALAAPYSDAPETSGLARYQQPELDRMTVERARLGFQIGFHAIGDRGVAMALEAFAAAEAAVPQASHGQLRFRIEHDQVIAPADLGRQASLHVIASMQPSHLLTDMRWARERLGEQRARYSYAWRSMLDHGIPLAFGTDYPVEPVTPFRGLYAAVTRRGEPGSAAAGDPAYFAAERLTPGEALYAYTQGAAYAEGREQEKGRLVPGELADFVALDRDLLEATPAGILQTRVLRTVVGGETVYAAARPSAGAHR